MRRLLRRQPARRSFQRTGPYRPDRVDEPRAPRCHGRRGRHRRRRGHSAAGPGRALPSRCRVRSPRRGSLRHRHRVPADRRRRLRQGDRRDRVDDGRQRARGRGLAGTPDRSHVPGRHRARGDAAVHAAVRQRPRGHERHRPRSQGVRGAQAPPSRADGRTRHVLRVVVLPHGRLQGDAHDPPVECVLLRSDRRSHRVGAAHRALPVLDEHVPVVAARPPLPVRRPQRRDQHGPGQRELDARPRSDDRQRPAPRVGGLLPDLHAGCLRHGALRRGARTAAPRRLPDPSRDADDDPGGLGEPRHDVAGAARLLPLPRLDDGTVGRSGERRVHRWRDDRRGARPQRPAAEPLLDHRRRPGRDGIRGRRDRHRTVAGGREGPVATRQDVPHRHARGPRGQRRGDQVDPRRAVPVRAVAGRWNRQPA